MFRPAVTLFTVAACLATNPARPPARLVAEPTAPALPVPGSTFRIPHSALPDPVAMLEESARRYAMEWKGFRATLRKQERIAGVLHPPEEVRVSVRESPYAARLLWVSGARAPTVAGLSLGTVEGALYAAGENGGQMLVFRPSAFLAKVAAVPPAGDSARAASRYALTEAGLGHVARRTWRAWESARQRGDGRAESLGVRPVPELGGRECHVLRRVCGVPECDPFLMAEPRPDAAADPASAFMEVVVYLDVQTGLQLGCEQRDAAGGLVGAYHFRDVEKNPAFAADEFKREGLRRP